MPSAKALLVMRIRYQSAFTAACDAEVTRRCDLLKSSLALYRLPTHALKELAVYFTSCSMFYLENVVCCDAIPGVVTITLLARKKGLMVQ